MHTELTGQSLDNQGGEAISFFWWQNIFFRSVGSKDLFTSISQLSYFFCFKAEPGSFVVVVDK